MGSGAADFQLAGGVISGREAHYGVRMRPEEANRGKVSNHYIYSELREKSLCQAKSCSAEAREAIQVLNGGGEVGKMTF